MKHNLLVQPVAAMVVSLENASLKQMTKHLARISAQQTLLVVTSRVRVCNNLTCNNIIIITDTG